MGLGTPGLARRLVVQNAQAAARVIDWGDAAEAAPALARIDDLALVHYAGFFAQRPRNATNLRSLLADYFRLPVAVEQFRGQWLAIPESGQTRLGEFGSLGVDAVAGERVWDVQSRFRVRLGPLRYPQFEDLLPDPAPIVERKTFFLGGTTGAPLCGIRVRLRHPTCARGRRGSSRPTERTGRSRPATGLDGMARVWPSHDRRRGRGFRRRLGDRSVKLGRLLCWDNNGGINRIE